MVQMDGLGEPHGMDIALDKKIKILITIWPFAILLFSGLLFHEVTLISGFIAVLPVWIFAWLKKD